MKVIFGGRLSGKTTKLIEMSAKTGSYIVCPSINDCIRIRSMANTMELKIPFPISAYEFEKGQYSGSGVKSFLIDDVDQILQGMTGVPIEAMSIFEARIIKL